MITNYLVRGSAVRGTSYRYQYRYADPRQVGPRQPLQLQFWIPKGRRGGAWVAHHDTPAGNYRTWRRVFPNHAHADKLAHSIAGVKSGGEGRSAADRAAQCAAYCAWARASGLKYVTVFAGDAISHTAAMVAGLDFRGVDAAEFIGPAPMPEIEG